MTYNYDPKKPADTSKEKDRTSQTGQGKGRDMNTPHQSPDKERGGQLGNKDKFRK